MLRTAGEPTTVEDLTLAEPRAGEVRVRILASGVCHSDLHVRDGDWPRPTPIAMGHEGAGVVEAIGPGVRSLTVGQPVALSWLVPCGVCRACVAGRPWACPDSPSFRHRMPDGATVLADDGGSAVLSYCGIGTMASATVVPEAAAIALPDGVDPAVAALIGCCVTTGVGAVLKTAQVPAGASVAVIGLGGVGLSCVMGAVLAGAARIVAVDRVAAKLDVARTLGATDALLASDDQAATVEALRDLTDGGPDFVFEAIGRPATVELAIEIAAARRDGGAGRDDAGRGAGVVRGLPVRRWQPADPRLELRVRRSARRLPALRRAPSCRPAADRAPDRPPDRARRPGSRLRPTARRRRPAPGASSSTEPAPASATARQPARA